MSRTVNLRLPDELVSRIDHFARMLGNGTTRTQATLILLDEALREEEFPEIEFRNTSIGRQSFVEQTGMAVWEFIMVAQGFGMDAERTAEYLQCPVGNVKSALNYYDVYREEIDQALQENDMGEERLKRLFPNLRVFTFSMQDGEPSSS
jgi:predicted transcriptional regulator